MVVTGYMFEELDLSSSYLYQGRGRRQVSGSVGILSTSSALTVNTYEYYLQELQRFLIKSLKSVTDQLVGTSGLSR